ncbi:aldo/keto reductase [Streptomyces sp. NBC_00102]|uniref:aldo/keto reductase n=1 Tax=Streptomyces sp. NBC_00102 TaxID=2975652 RepID=UPI0022546233|nr:aldo/keto reductase [Streptomyces sp. NBC_00102]MCX5397735.1 aldo/keto reductase [Streptomyces sp. NBC_00102]
MRHHRIGDRNVSALCLGAMPFGARIDEETSFALLDRFVERGGNFIDTADNYCFWIDGRTGDESETLLGRWFARRGNRDEVILASKLGGRPVGPVGTDRSQDILEGLSAPAVRAALKGSLERLGTDRVDLLYRHVDDPATPQEETVRVFGELIADGTVGMAGVSNLTAERLRTGEETATALGLPGAVALQQRHTYLRPLPGTDFGVQRYADDAVLAEVRRRPGLTLLAYTALLDGAYSNPAKPLPAPYDHPVSHRQLAALRQVAAESGATVNQVVYAWLLGGDPVVLPVIGVSTFGQLDEALEAVDVELTADQRTLLDTARAEPLPGE